MRTIFQYGVLNSQVANKDCAEVSVKFPATAVTVITNILPGYKSVKWAVLTVVVLLYKYSNSSFEMFTT